MESVRLRAFAKVNYALEVRGPRPDGYHDICTVMQSVSLADEIEIERAREGFDLVVEPEGRKTGPLKKNTVYRAWATLRNLSGEELPVRMRLHKRIPSGAGLGGGSADAAAALVGLNELFGLGLSLDDLRGAGVGVGADVPFCISGGTALGEGVGEILTPLPAPPEHHLVVAKPFRGAWTAMIYRVYDESPSEETLVEPVVAALEMGDLAMFARSVGNVFSPVTGRLVPEVGEYRRNLLRAGALGAAMSGSGTAVYGIFGSREEAEKARLGLQAPFAEVCEPVGCGIEMLEDASRSKSR